MKNLHVIIGEDDFLVSQTVKKILGNAEGLEVIDSNLSSNAELQLRDIAAADESFSTPPFLDPVKITWWKNIHFLPSSGGKSCSEDVKAALERLAKKFAASPLPENQTFIISGTKLLSTSIFAKTLKSAAEMTIFSAGKPWEKGREAALRAVEFAAAQGISFAPGAADIFVSRVGSDTRSIMSEVEKLRDYLGGERNTATSSDVAEITSQGVGVEPEVWSITDALGERNPAKLAEALGRFERENSFAVLVTTVVEKFFRTLLELKDAAASGRRDEATQGLSPFAVKKNIAFLANWTLLELRIARARFMALRERVVSSAGSADILVMTELMRTVRRQKGARL